MSGPGNTSKSSDGQRSVRQAVSDDWAVAPDGGGRLYSITASISSMVVNLRRGAPGGAFSISLRSMVCHSE